MCSSSSCSLTIRCRFQMHTDINYWIKCDCKPLTWAWRCCSSRSTQRVASESNFQMKYFSRLFSSVTRSASSFLLYWEAICPREWRRCFVQRLRVCMREISSWPGHSRTEVGWSTAALWVCVRSGVCVCVCVCVFYECFRMCVCVWEGIGSPTPTHFPLTPPHIHVVHTHTHTHTHTLLIKTSCMQTHKFSVLFSRIYCTFSLYFLTLSTDILIFSLSAWYSAGLNPSDSMRTWKQTKCWWTRPSGPSLLCVNVTPLPAWHWKSSSDVNPVLKNGHI